MENTFRSFIINFFQVNKHVTPRHLKELELEIVILKKNEKSENSLSYVKFEFGVNFK